MDCIFCKIANGQVSAKKVYENKKILAFQDMNPVAPVHILFIPKEHICCINDINIGNSEIIGNIFCSIAEIARKMGLGKGYRVISNCGEDGGQTVEHLHFHLIGGKKLGWPGVD